MPYDISIAAWKAKEAVSKPDHPTKVRNEDIAERAKAGESLASIGRSYWITRERVRQIASTYGVVVGRGTKMKSRRAERAKRLAEAVDQEAALASIVRTEIEVNRLSIKATGKKLGIGRGRAWRLTRRYGIRSHYRSGNPNLRGERDG